MFEQRMWATVTLLAAESRRIVPIDTGNLKGSLIEGVSKSGEHGHYGSNKIWAGEAPVPYAINVEAYSRHPQPYLRPPLETRRHEVQAIWGGGKMSYRFSSLGIPLPYQIALPAPS